jgi:hypothetical protein
VPSLGCASTELYNLKADFSQAENLPAREPKRLEAMKALFLKEARDNKAFPIGAGIWLRIHPEDRIKTPYTSWQFDATTTRLPEFAAPPSSSITLPGCSTRWAVRPVASRCTWTRANSSTSTT